MDSMHLVGSGSRHYAPYDWSSSTKFTFVISQSQKALINCTSLSFGIIWKNELNFCTFSQSSTISIIGIFLVFLKGTLSKSWLTWSLRLIIFKFCPWLSLFSFVWGRGRSPQYCAVGHLKDWAYRK